MCTSGRTASTSNPTAAIWASRLGRVCSRDTYRPFAARCRAFAWRIAYVRVDFIVPGRPETSTTCPSGKPPSSTSSRPSMNVGIFFLAIALPPTRPGQGEATRPPEPFEFPVEVLLEAEPQHLGQGEPADTMDRVALGGSQRAHPAGGARAPDLPVD